MTIRQIAIAQRTQESAVNKASALGTGDGHERYHSQIGVEGMCYNCYGSHKDDDVELSDSVIQQVKDAVFASVKEDYGYNDSHPLSDIIKSYVQTVDVDKRLASSRALNLAWFDEVDRIGQYIHSKDPNWTVWGQKFDLSILDDYKQGIDVKA